MDDTVNKKILIVLTAVLCLAVSPAGAESRQFRDSLKHEVRIGWGDQMFEKLIWQKSPYIISNMPESYTKNYKERYRYTQHWFAEYQWRVNGWFGLGFQADVSGCVWDKVTRNGLGNETAREKNESFWNLTMMPMMRFTWFDSEYVSLYTALGAGLGINGGTETDAYGRHTLCGFAFDLSLIGVTVDWNRWSVFAEFGGLTSFKDVKTTIFMFNSRMISIGAGFKF